MTQSSLPYEEVALLAEALPSSDKVRLIKQLARMLEREYIAQLPEAPGWPASFFEHTYGSLSDDPIERPPQGQAEERDSIE